jgi:hypothetical protein
MIRSVSQFLFVLATVIVVGAFAIWRLSYYRTYADELQDRFQRNTQYVSDLKVFAADARAFEAANLIPQGEPEPAQGGQELDRLDDLIALAQHSYEHVRHGPDEAEAYARYHSQWLAYRQAAGQVVALSRAGRGPEALALFAASSRPAYAAVSGTLVELSDDNLAEAGATAQKADAAYRDSCLMTIAVAALAALVVLGQLFQARATAGQEPVKAR